ncbi:hypothetical protein CLHUN_28620 [Ruminiclostridium hungatei]|uniref:Lipoprotein n=1 Tax=Ruminiclostridium hungatei TaxID=48256 RepID=A0A1V4SHN9_RUMHU|nr:hypothetical protein [Ruminiclostridium hungatei]OPX43314.1 hypothetical protein CLHUN_28620 [Ruminiclostridium hungatei]
MKIRELLLLIVITLILTSCNTVPSNNSSASQFIQPMKQKEVLSPFTQFENLERNEDMVFNSKLLDDILKSYGIYDRLLEKVPKEDYIDSLCSDIKINGFSIENKKVAVLQIIKGHLYIYIMFSNSDDKWMVDGFAYQKEREKPEYRVEKSSDQAKYWLVIRHEANHGSGLQLFDEIWYNPDGSVAGEYPVEGSALFFPEMVVPEANAYFSASVDYDGDSSIYLSYSISFEYTYKSNAKDSGLYGLQSKFRPAVRDNWEYDLKTRQLKFLSCDTGLPQGFSRMEHLASDDFGILQGYIDFYRTRLGDKKVATLGEWEKFISAAPGLTSEK